MNKRTLLLWLTVISMVILTFPISQAIVPTAAASTLAHLARGRAASSHAWSVVASPNRSSSYNQLNAVATIAANDIWAVGFYDNSNDTGQTLTEHWNGSTWSVVASPNVSPYDNVLEGVSAVSVTDVWAVGYYDKTPGQTQRLIEHWNGNKWSIVPNPEHKGGLFAVAAVSANDVWAVGAGGFGNGIEHWNGTQWSIVSSPNPGLGSLFLSVAAVSATDIWAVGSYYNAGSRTLIEHWDGTSWSVVPSPNPDNEEASLSGVTAVSASDIWAVGSSINQGNLQPLTEQWNGTQWSIVSSPNPGGSSQLIAAAAVSASDVWAVGDSNASKTLIEQWNGTAWSIVSSPSPGGGGDLLSGVAALSATNIWAVGSYFSKHDVELTLIEHET